jgi:hypothetical protein
MKTHYRFLFVMMLGCTALFPQQFTWARQYGINSTLAGRGIVSDAAGNIYFTGIYSGSGDQDPSQGTFVLNNMGEGDAFIGKMSASGDLVWLKSVGGPRSDGGWAISADGSGNVYVGGNFRGTVDFDPGAGTYTLQSPVYQSIWDSDAFLLKLDNNGNFVWAGAISGEKDEWISEMVIDHNKIIVTGMFGGVTDFDIKAATTSTMNASLNRQAFVAAFDFSGALQWADMVDGDSNGLSVAADGSGNIYSIGVYSGTSDFDPSAGTLNLVTAGGQDVYVWKLDGNGNVIWTRSVGGANTESGNDLAVDATGNVYLTGYFQKMADFDPGAGVYPLTATPGSDAMDPGTDIFVMKMSNAGNFVWAKSMGGLGYDHGDELALDQSGHVYLAGVFQYTVDFDPSYKEATLVSDNPFDEVFINKLTTSGDLLWVGQIVGEDIDDIGGLYIGADNTILLTGMFKKTADLDPTSGQKLVTSAGVTNGYVIKLNGSFDLTFTGLKSENPASFKIYPNPTQNFVKVAHEFSGATKITVYNVVGAMVKNITTTGQQETIEMGSLGTGIYIIEIKNNTLVERRKVIVE